LYLTASGSWQPVPAAKATDGDADHPVAIEMPKFSVFSDGVHAVPSKCSISVSCPVAENTTLGEPGVSVHALAVWLSHGAGPSVHVMDALPFWSVVDDGADGLPPPAEIPQFTLAFGMGAPLGVVTSTTSGAGNAVENCPFCASPETIVTNCVGGVAEKVTLGAPSALVHALTDCSPDCPSVQVVVAFPDWSVVEDDDDSVPPPETIPQLTTTPGTGLPFASVTETTSGAGSVWP
jgi:hypothetical protein